ncbi:MAG: alanine racemase [Actinobacteria bacterium]|uniref:Unannotated protein n=1 Tax=freshwater metagenome TaxID=449393 RepID=A0A6J5ZSB1_9ZZZZ|nr:alanine racemase [Actinomycetota bacterium]
MEVRALASVNLAAIERNVGLLRRSAPTSQLCAVVKADGYGHGAVQAARAALAGGAEWLAVATAQEAVEIRGAGITSPLLVLGALTQSEVQVAVGAGADISAWSSEFLDRVVAGGGARVHIKLDTGMGRLGTRDQQLASDLAAVAAQSPGCRLVGVMTHFATADERGDGFFDEQLDCFSQWSAPIAEANPGLLRHAANSAALIRDRRSHFDMVRPGVACYGLDPFGEDPHAQQLEPAMELSSYLAAGKPCEVGQSVGYGRTFIASSPTMTGTIPVGYADGYKRVFSNNGDVLIGGKRFPIVGNVSMDNCSVDLGLNSDPVRLGDKAILLGADGGEEITAEELARQAGTINYEIVTSVSGRVPRRYHRDGAKVGDND